METLKTSQTKMGKFIAAAEFNRFGVISIVLTVVGILGGVTTGLGAVENTFLLSLVVYDYTKFSISSCANSLDFSSRIS